jgi:exoribonuclease-2
VEKGTLLEYRLQGERRLAVADRPDGKKNWIVIDEFGQSQSLPPRQISYEVTGEQYKPTDIPRFREDAEPYIDPSSLEVAWEILVEEGQGVNPPELAQFLFSEQTPVACYAAYLLLSEDKLYFKQKGDRYEPRPVSQVNDLKHQQEVERQKQQEWEEFVARVERSLAGEQAEWSNSDRIRIEALERYAAQGEDAKDRATAKETLSALERPDSSQGAFDLLVDLGLWSEHENLFVRRTQLPTYFSTKVLEVAHRCLTSPPLDPDADNRLDLTHLKVYTIDDESTEEIDDGLSVESLEDGRQRLWVHIADPTRWLTPGDELDLEARRRCTTVYLPTGMVPMFPPELATGPMSLVQGKICPALSFGIVLDDNGAVEDYTIHPSIIKPTYRLTYHDVDEMLQLGIQAEPEIAQIAESAKKRQQWRDSQGAIGISMPESTIKVCGDEIFVEVLDDSPARQLVAEMMILTGEVAGHFGQRENIPLPFRSQPTPELPPPEELQLLPPGPVRACAIRRCMPRSEISTKPGRHASLALDNYTQVTSPIRRYSDLLAHFQIKAYLRGDEVPFSSQDLQDVMLSISSSIKEASVVERQTNRYWALEYLRRHPNQVWQVLVLRWLREEENLGLILLEELGMELPWRFPRAVSLGERLEVQVTHSDPREDQINFQEMLYQTAQTSIN